MPDFDPHQWFADEELEVCPACGERAALRIPTATLACVACGLIRSPADDETGRDHAPLSMSGESSPERPAATDTHGDPSL